MLLTGTSNVAERELAGARPDVAVVGMSGHEAVHGYPDRLLAALGSPSLLLPCHHDDMVTPSVPPGSPARCPPGRWPR